MKKTSQLLALGLVVALAFTFGAAANQQTASESRFANEVIDLGMVVSDLDK